MRVWHLCLMIIALLICVGGTPVVVEVDPDIIAAVITFAIVFCVWIWGMITGIRIGRAEILADWNREKRDDELHAREALAALQQKTVRMVFEREKHGKEENGKKGSKEDSGQSDGE